MEVCSPVPTGCWSILCVELFRRRRQTAIPSVSPSFPHSFSLLPCALFCRHMKPSLNPLLRHLSSSQSLFFISFFFSKGLCLKLDAKKNVQKMSYFLFIKTQTVSPPTTTSYITERLLLLKYCIRFLCRCLRM